MAGGIFPAVAPNSASPHKADPWAEFQMDPPAGSPSQAADPWAEFKMDAPAGSPSQADPWGEFKMDAPAQPSPLRDMATALPTGVARGTAETAMLPMTLERLLRGGVDGVLRGAENAGRWAIGAPTVSADDFAKRGEAAQASPLNLNRYADSAQDTVRQGMNDVLPKPQTTAGKYAGAVGEFLPSLFAGGPLTGSVRQMAARTLGDVVVPALTSEAAGQATEGTRYEPAARLIGGLGGNLATGAYRANTSAIDRTIQNATEGVTPQQVQDAQRLLDQGRSMGITLTLPEALQQVTGGGTKLGDLMRVTEYAPRGAGRLLQTFADRPAQVDQALGDVLGGIAPRSTQPYSLGGQASDIASTGLRQIEQQRTDAVQPLYLAANGQRVNPDDVADIIAGLDQTGQRDTSGLLHPNIQRVRDSLVERPAVPATATTPARPEVPVTDVENLARIRRHYLEEATPGQPGMSSATKEQNLPLNDATAQLRNILAGVPEQAAADAEFARLSRELVDPARRGPLGNVAAAGDTRAAASALLPSRTTALVGGEGELGQAVQRMGAVEAAPAPGATGPTMPTVTPALVRNGLENSYNASQGRTMGGLNQSSGAYFAKTVAGSPQQQANLGAVLGALPNGGANSDRMSELLNVLSATGQRKPMGSGTSFNNMIASELSDIPVTSALTTNPIRTAMAAAGNLNERLKQRVMGGRVAQLADLFLDPQAGARVQSIIDAGREPIWRNTMIRQGLQTPGELNPRGP